MSNKLSPLDKFKRKASDTLDRPCSALALNCFQLGCFIPNVPRGGFHGGTNSDWMQHLCKVNPDVKLRSLCIPGTHDSATDTISPYKPYSAMGRTQNVSIGEQLLRGIRYLDIRIAGFSNGVGIFHGCLMGAPLGVVLSQITDFLQNHVGEFLFIEIVQEFGRDFTPAQKKSALDMIQESLGPFQYKDDDRNKLLNDCTLQELTQANTRICLMVHPRIYFELDGINYDREMIGNTYHAFDSGKSMYNKWHNTRDTNLLLQWNLEETQRRAEDSTKILTNQFVLTPGISGAADIPRLLLGLVSLRPASFAMTLIPPMEEFFRQHANEPWNIVVMDFIDLVPGLLSFLISLNFGAELEIVKATVNNEQGVDVTEMVSKFVYRTRVLFLSDVRKDLDISEREGTLHIEYKLDGDETHIMEWEFDDDTEVVLSEYSHMMGKE